MPKTNLLDVIQQGEIGIAMLFLQGVTKQIKDFKNGNEQQLEILNDARAKLIRFIHDVKKNNFDIDKAKHYMQVLREVINNMEDGLDNFAYPDAFAKFMFQIKKTHTDLINLISKQQAKAAQKTINSLTKKTLNFTGNKEHSSSISKKSVIKSTDRPNNKHK